MKLNDIFQKASKHKARRRVGRGTGSGHGKTSGRGHKGRGQRSGVGQRLGYEGGQNPVLARSPKRGFSNVQFATPVQIVKVGELDGFEDGMRVDAALLAEVGLIADPTIAVKILSNGELSKKLTVVATKFSAQAAEKIAAAGGSCEQA